MRALVFGYHTMGCVGLDALLRSSFEVTAVFTHADDPHEEVWWGSLADRAGALGIPVHRPEKADLKTDAFTEFVASYHPDFIFSFYFRWMIPTRVLTLAPRGAFNLHGSLLPRYRGRAPVNWVLVNGEKETGVSLHAMVAMADAGDLLDQERVPIALEETALTLYGKLEAAAATLLDRALPALRDGIAHLRPMNLEEGSYFGGRTPEDGRFEWNWSAERIYNLVRAVTHPYPGAFTAWRDRKLLVWWALPIRSFPAAPPGTVLAVDLDGVTVAAGAGAGAVRLVTVQLDGQPELPACSFARGAGIAPGTRFGDPRPSSDPGPLTSHPASRRGGGNGDTP